MLALAMRPFGARAVLLDSNSVPLSRKAAYEMKARSALTNCTRSHVGPRFPGAGTSPPKRYQRGMHLMLPWLFKRSRATTSHEQKPGFPSVDSSGPVYRYALPDLLHAVTMHGSPKASRTHISARSRTAPLTVALVDGQNPHH